MERWTIDAGLPDKLKNLTTSVELVDAEGHVIAVVHPQFDPALYEMVGREISEEELERRARAPGKRYTTDEVIARLRKLA